MHRTLLTLAVATLTLFSACSKDAEVPTHSGEVQPAQAWTDPVLETLQKGELKIDIFEHGTGKVAKEFDQVSVHYTGWIRNSENVFDSSASRKLPFSFPLGAGRVIAGWDQGIEGLTVGTRARLHVPWAMGYGKRGNGPIPGQADLVFDVELVGAK